MSTYNCLLAMAGIVIFSACQSRGSESGVGQTAAAGTTTAARRDTSGAMASMPGMSGGTMDSGTNTMMDSMRIEMARMDAMTPSQMKSTMATHRQMAGNMLAQMNGEMRSMNMTADPAWTALVDSVRQDLVHMPDLSGAELKAFMTAHHARMQRLMAMHREMMGKMAGRAK